MMGSLQLLPLILVAAIAALAVLHPDFDDNLMQRVGLSGICIGATIRIAQILSTFDITTKESSTVLFYGLAFYGVGTVLKFRKLHKNDKIN